MAHSPQKKAQALALLMVGNTPRHVAAQLGIPLTTCKRWQKEVPAMWGDVLGPEGRATVRAALADIAAMFPGLVRR